jgi:hypothetical protein
MLWLIGAAVLDFILFSKKKLRFEGESPFQPPAQDNPIMWTQFISLRPL